MTRQPPANHDHSKTGTGGGKINPAEISGANIKDAADDDVLTTTGQGTLTTRAREGVPSGGIIMWSGAIVDVPDGWTLCDGTDGAPDLQDRFVVGAGNSYNVDDIGGADEVTLTEPELPSHNHRVNTSSSSDSTNNNDYLLTNDIQGSQGDNNVIAGGQEATGGDQAHENRPPYYAMAYIMKT